MVYGLIADDRLEVVVVLAVAVGLRQALDVYHTAALRLERHR